MAEGLQSTCEAASTTSGGGLGYFGGIFVTGNESTKTSRHRG